jgi:hypothetical protein
MSQRIIGFVLLGVAVVASVVAFGGMDARGAALMSQRGFAEGFRAATTYAGLDLSLVISALIAVGLVGVGLIVFGKRE